MSVMKLFPEIRAYFFVGCLLAASVSACLGQTAANTGGDLKSLQDQYKKAIAKIDSDAANAAQSQPATYLKELYKIQQALQKAGDLDGLTAANSELERFKSKQTVPDQPDQSLPPDIRNLQTAFKAALAKADLDKNKKLVSTTKQYVELLNSLQTSLTKAGKVDQAMDVSAEIKRVKSDPKITSAEFVVAAVDTEKQPARDESSAQPAKDDKAGNDKANQPTGTVTTDASGATIYDGKPFPDAAAGSFKPMKLSVSENTPGIPKLNMTAMLDTENNMDKSTSAYWSRTSSSKSGNMKYVLRVTVKSANKTLVVDNAKLVVEYFAKDVAAQGRGNPKVFDSKTVPLSKIDGARTIGVEFPEITFSSSSSRVISRYYGVMYSGSGSDLYGFVVSVFDSSGTLVAQAASTSTLQKLGTTKLPK
jgi:hypothetical protein